MNDIHHNKFPSLSDTEEEDDVSENDLDILSEQSDFVDVLESSNTNSTGVHPDGPKRHPKRPTSC
jgi:hypothetical protein